MPNLPIRRMILYKHGVGYFERRGAVAGTELRLSFPRGWLTQHPLTWADLRQEKDFLEAIGIRLRLRIDRDARNPLVTELLDKAQ